MGKEILREYLKSHGLRQSSQRDHIVDTFLATGGHSSAKSLLAQVRQKDPRIGLTTVYRTLKILTRCGLAVERKFNSQISHFEQIPEGRHHDHLICLKCGKIMEFENTAIKSLRIRWPGSLNFGLPTISWTFTEPAVVASPAGDRVKLNDGETFDKQPWEAGSG